MPSVVANNLAKHYGKKKEVVQALKGVSFEVERASCLVSLARMAPVKLLSSVF